MAAPPSSKCSSHAHHTPSSAADQPEYSTRKRVGKACDSCRIKKSKCDGRKPCSRCIMDDKICTFAERKKSKEKVYSSRYVELLENRIEILQNGMAELIRRVNRGDDISGLLSKSGHISINKALEELTSEVIELQNEERERFAIVNDHTDSEHDTEHEHEHDHDHDNDSVATSDIKMEDRSTESAFGQQGASPRDLKVDTTVGQTSFTDSGNWAAVPFLSVGTNIGAYDPETGAMSADFINPATIIRGHSQPEPLSPSSMTSASSLYSSSAASPSPIDLHFVAFDNSTNTVKSLSEVYDAFNDVGSNSMEADPMMAKVDGLSDMWLTNTFMEI
ncbi:hypothetical protein V1525DRAFT_207832 [Lipomyces kononenkoae]|uniref:Uncharacterized protein n=1 Tax=Lipomyces kononenkoae TaxID=34357 RepID=A0ACC3T9B0_LIPKO